MKSTSSAQLIGCRRDTTAAAEDTSRTELPLAALSARLAGGEERSMLFTSGVHFAAHEPVRNYCEIAQRSNVFDVLQPDQDPEARFDSEDEVQRRERIDA